MKTIIATAVTVASTAAQAHPGHGETLHAHPELWVAIVVISLAVAYFRRNVVQ